MKFVPIIICLVSITIFTGCMEPAFSVGMADENGYDPFPKPTGPWMIPLDKSPQYIYHYAELDKDGNKLPPFPPLILTISPAGPDTKSVYKYGFEKNTFGHLMIFKQYPASETGLYIIGRFYGDSLAYGDTALWIPQAPDKVEKWRTWGNRSMEYISFDSNYVTSSIFSGISISFPFESQLQNHGIYTLKETADDTATYWYFSRGVGIIGFERMIAGKTRAVGTLKEAYVPNLYRP